MRINLINFIRLLSGFSAVGMISSLLSLLLIYIFLKLFRTPLFATYISIYIVTILLSYIINSIFVFKSSLSMKKGIKYSMIYLTGMLLGTFLLWIFKKITLFENYILGYLTLPFTMVWNFALSYKLFKL
jgi:putative flippase GtrA